MTPTARTLKALRDIGATAEVVERHNHYAGPPHMTCPSCKKNRIGQKKDFLGCLDIIAMLGANIIGVQVTSGANHAARVKKIKAEPRALAWLEAGGLIEVHSWLKKNNRWVCRRQEITREDLS